MDFTLPTYALYLMLTIGLTLWVARTLFTNGRVFLHEIFRGQSLLADSVNKLLLMGFYLVNIGYAVYTMKILGHVIGPVELAEVLSQKVGAIILILGAMHLLNLFVLFRLRRRAQEEARVQTLNQ